MGRVLLSLLLGGGIFALVGYQAGLFTKTKPDTVVAPKNGGDQARKQASSAELKLGAWLFKPAAAPMLKFAQADPSLKRDPVVLGGHMTVLDKIDVSSNLPGQLLFIGEEVPEGAAQVAGVGPFLYEPFQYAPVEQAGRELIVLYRRLYEDQIVHGNQVVAKINPAKALGELAIKRARVSASHAESRAAVAAFEEAKKRYERADRLFKDKIIAAEDHGAALLTMIKFYEDSVTKGEAVRLSMIEEDQAEIQLRLHDVRNKIPAQRSFIKTIYRNRGEALREQEPVLQLYSLERLRAEALVEVQDLARIRPGIRVTIEPTQEEGPLRVLPGHRGEITGVAVMGKPTQPLIFTASEDRFVAIWNRYSRSPLQELAHPEPVRSLAVSPPLPGKKDAAAAQEDAGKENPGKANQADTGAKDEAGRMLCLAGLANGSIYVWEVKQTDQGVEIVSSEPSIPKPKVIERAHRDAVTSLAFSPDGAFFATGSADSTINLYRTSDLGLIYRFDAEHGAVNPHSGAITSLHFIPQQVDPADMDDAARTEDEALRAKGEALTTIQLVSASRDNSVRLWKLMQNGAALRSVPLTGRSGTVPYLGVSRDGKYLLFDRGKDLQLLSGQDSRKLNTLKHTVAGVAFDTLAVFSPDSSLLLTAGAAEGHLQIWRAPTETARGFAVWTLAPNEKERFPVTCAAFSPAAGQPGDASFVVSGTKEGYVYLWPVPTADEMNGHRIKNVPVGPVGQSLDATARQVRVGMEIPNPPTARHPNGRFLPGRPVTIVID